MPDSIEQDVQKINIQIEKLTEKNKEAQRLYNFAKFFAHALSTDEVIQLGLSAYSELGQTPNVFFLAYDAGKLVLNSALPQGKFSGHLQKPLVSLEHMSENGIEAWLQQINQDSVFRKTLMLYFHTENFFASPLLMGDKPFGVLVALGHSEAVYDQRIASMLNQLVPFMNLALSALFFKSRLEREGLRDEGSDLFNGKYLQYRLGHEIARADRYGYPLSCVMLDVDFYKLMRDKEGFPFAQQVMRKLSHLLDRHTRKSDIMIRTGVDEYLWLLPHCSKEKAKWACDNLLKSLEKFPISRTKEAIALGESARLTLSMGVSEFPTDAKAQKPLLGFAEAALRVAKERGRNQGAIFDEGMLHALTMYHETKVIES